MADASEVGGGQARLPDAACPDREGYSERARTGLQQGTSGTRYRGEAHARGSRYLLSTRQNIRGAEALHGRDSGAEPCGCATAYRAQSLLPAWAGISEAWQNRPRKRTDGTYAAPQE